MNEWPGSLDYRMNEPFERKEISPTSNKCFHDGGSPGALFGK
jgi:hypothetical protein